MEYLLSFLEGIITFVSPCLLPMLPIYISYFAGQDGQTSKNKTIVNAFGFVTGFTLVFVAMGAFASTLGGVLKNQNSSGYNVFNVIGGIIIILFGLNFIGILKIPLLNKTITKDTNITNLNFFSSLVFGMVFSIGWTPCVGAMLGSALMLAASSGEGMKGVFMLLSFSVGLGIPFILSAILIDKLKSTFALMKKHHQAISIISGSLLIIVGVLMATGLLGYFLSLISV